MKLSASSWPYLRHLGKIDNLIRDPSGSLKFSSKAVLHANGVDFSNGQSFKINMDEMEVQGELGKGNYGTVQKVFHRPTGVMMAMKVSLFVTL